MPDIVLPRVASKGTYSLSFREIFSPEYWITFFRGASNGIITAAGQILLIIALFIVVRFAVFKVIDRILIPMAKREAMGIDEAGRVARIRTLQGLVKSVAAYVLGFIAGIMCLRAMGVDPIPALTTAGVAALAVGFGAQLLVRDVITGFFILLENQYAVGDYVTIGTVTGTVEEIGMRITRLRDDIGKLIILSNGAITQVINHSRGSLLAAVDISIPAGADTKKAVEIFNKVGEEIDKDRQDVVMPFKCEGIASMDAAKITFRLAGRVVPKKTDEVSVDLRTRLHKRLVEDGVGVA